jgi:Uma2 family endonuclease
MSASEAATRKLSLEEFLGMDVPEDGAKLELVNGEIVVTPAPDMARKRVQSFLHEWFGILRLKHPRYVSYSELSLSLWAGHHAIPDFVIARPERRGGPCRETVQLLEGPPAVVVEVLSPTRQWRDLVQKRSEYEQGRVPEYWLFDPTEPKAFFFRLGAGHYREYDRSAGRVHQCASVPGLRLDVDASFRSDPTAGVAALGPGFGST